MRAAEGKEQRKLRVEHRYDEKINFFLPRLPRAAKISFAFALQPLCGLREVFQKPLLLLNMPSKIHKHYQNISNVIFFF